jgi:hypothetical protein
MDNSIKTWRGFLWPVCVQGYEWLEEYDDFLLRPVPPGQYRDYKPLIETPGLFRVFSETEPTPEGFLGFVNRFGPLGYGRSLGMVDLRQAPADKLKYYVRESDRMREAVAAWDRFQQREADAAALGRIKELVNHETVERVNVYLVDDTLRGGLKTEMIPNSLLAAMWLQFAWSVTGERPVRQCETCGEWFGAAPDSGRSDKVYCGETCRTKAYRRRKEEARLLHQAGKTAKEIAEALDTKVKTVEGWVGKKMKG